MLVALTTRAYTRAMENLSEKVYECSLAVEAHMVCDLLARAGISARVDGEFLQSGGGELPLGNLVKVRVDPARAAEAREVIADWEKEQAADVSAPVSSSPRVRASMWFGIGAMVGGVVVFLVFDTPVTSQGVDYDGDGVYEVTYHYAGSRSTSTEYDRNDDRRIDGRWKYNRNGYETGFEWDDDFDGKFEWQGEVARGQPTRSVLDVDNDGRPEQMWHFKHGVITRAEYFLAGGGRVVKREFYKAGLLASAELDDDGDGVFERKVRYDEYGEPEL